MRGNCRRRVTGGKDDAVGGWTGHVHGRLLDGLANALQRVPRFARGVEHLVDLGGGHIFAVHAAHAFAVKVDFQHDLGRAFAVFAEEFLQHQHHKLHGREVIVQHDDLVHLWGFGFERFAL